MQGVVERIERQGKRTALRIGGEWYSTFEPIRVSEGDRVRFEYRTVEKSGRTYKNLKAIEVLAEPSAAQGTAAGAGEPPEAERIARSVALKCAVEACGPGIEAAEVLATAEAFLEFLLGRRTEITNLDHGATRREEA
jgi:hypothetical protein